MNAEQYDREKLIELAEALKQAAERDDEKAVDEAMQQLSALHDHSLFNELGRLTRDFHENLNEYEREHFTGQFAEKDLPDAGDRLQHVIDLTQDAAHKTLKAAEESQARVKEILKKSNELADKAFEALEHADDPERNAAARKLIVEHQSALQELINQLQSSLTNVVMAQEYQDLSGQILRKVITLVTGLHFSLVALLGEAAHVQQAEQVSEKPLTSQDDVDDLLASLGF